MCICTFYVFFSSESLCDAESSSARRGGVGFNARRSVLTAFQGEGRAVENVPMRVIQNRMSERPCNLHIIGEINIRKN